MEDMQTKYQWSRLNKKQLGCYAEYYVRMEFMLYGFEVYKPEVDDRGIDFIIRGENKKVYDIQVKSTRKYDHIYFKKDKFTLRENMLAVVVTFNEGYLPKLYLIPSTRWKEEDQLFNGLDYRGLTSEPEWVLRLTKRRMGLLVPFAFDTYIKNFLKS